MPAVSEMFHGERCLTQACLKTVVGPELISPCTPRVISSHMNAFTCLETTLWVHGEIHSSLPVTNCWQVLIPTSPYDTSLFEWFTLYMAIRVSIFPSCNLSYHPICLNKGLRKSVECCTDAIPRIQQNLLFLGA